MRSHHCWQSPVQIHASGKLRSREGHHALKWTWLFQQMKHFHIVTDLAARCICGWVVLFPRAHRLFLRPDGTLGRSDTCQGISPHHFCISFNHLWLIEFTDVYLNPPPLLTNCSGSQLPVLLNMCLLFLAGILQTLYIWHILWVKYFGQHSTFYFLTRITP